MPPIEAALKLVRSEIICSKAQCSMPSDGGAVDESSLMGTRDAYLGLVAALLEFVAAAESGTAERLQNENAFWDDKVKDCFLPLPNRDAYLVGSYLFDSHEDHMKVLRAFTAWDETTHQSIEKDPAFQRQANDAEHGSTGST